MALADDLGTTGVVVAIPAGLVTGISSGVREVMALNASGSGGKREALMASGVFIVDNTSKLAVLKLLRQLLFCEPGNDYQSEHAIYINKEIDVDAASDMLFESVSDFVGDSDTDDILITGNHEYLTSVT
jgi:hypothetical protein